MLNKNHMMSSFNGDLSVPAASTAAGATASPSEMLDIKAVLKTLFRNKFRVLLPMLLATAAVLAYLVVVRPSYTASAQLLVDIQKPKIIGGEAFLPGLDTSRNMIGPVIDSQVEILRSPQFARRVIRRLQDEGVTVFDEKKSLISAGRRAARNGMQSVLEQLGAANTPTKSEPENDETVSLSVIGEFLRNLNVRRQGLTLLLSVRYTDTNPKRAALIANAVMEEYLDSQRESKEESALVANKRLEERVASLRNEVRRGQEQIRAYVEANNLVEIQGLTISEREITATLADMAAARGQAAGKLAELRQMEDLIKDPTAPLSIDRVLQSEVVQSFRSQETNVRRQMATLLSQYGKDHYAVAQKQAELRDIQDEIRKEIARIIEGTRNSYAVALQRIRLIENRLRQLTQEYTRRKRRSIRLAEMKQELEATNEHYKTLLARQKETQAQSSMLFPDARVVSRAATPRRPSAPRKTVLLLLAIVAGLGIGVTIVLLREHLLDIVQGPRDLEARSGLQHITGVPRLGGMRLTRKAMKGMGTSQLAQSFFMVKQSVMHSLSERNAAIVAIASPNDGEGKTTISTNFAQYLANVGHRTLLVDCDLRSADLTRTIMSSTGRTLVDVLNGDCQAQDAIIETEEGDLDFCPAQVDGDVRYSMELLASSEMRDFLQAASQAYDFVILDTSALLPYVDARSLIDVSDTTVLVVEDRKTSHIDIDRLLRLLPVLRDNASGVVINKSEAIA